MKELLKEQDNFVDNSKQDAKRMKFKMYDNTHFLCILIKSHIFKNIINNLKRNTSVNIK